MNMYFDLQIISRLEGVPAITPVPSHDPRPGDSCLFVPLLSAALSAANTVHMELHILDQSHFSFLTLFPRPLALSTESQEVVVDIYTPQ